MGQHFGRCSGAIYYRLAYYCEDPAMNFIGEISGFDYTGNVLIQIVVPENAPQQLLFSLDVLRQRWPRWLAVAFDAQLSISPHFSGCLAPGPTNLGQYPFQDFELLLRRIGKTSKVADKVPLPSR